MADESYASVSTSTASTAGRAPSFGGNAPSGSGLRRAATIGQASQPRRRATMNPASFPNENSFADMHRRSSIYSDYSMNDARRELEASADELFNPSKSTSATIHKSPFVYVPLTIALLPAVAGMFFENGSAFFTDLILLSLAAVFLHWSVTQPWDWYQSAQQVRVVQDEIMNEPVFDSDSEVESSPTPSATTALENVPEEKEKEKGPETPLEEPSSHQKSPWKERKAAAINELYVHEVLALAWCFIFPILGAYLLHTIRGQLSRPSEGLVSDYNLTIFLCAAEIRPVSHLIRMVQDRTLRVQQIVARNPYEHKSTATEQLQALSSRLDELDSRAPSGTPATSGHAQPEVPQAKIEMAVAREIRSTIQPELDALNRAMRRYEKKLTLLACQTDNRIEYVDYRLNDAIALAAVAAKNSNSQWTLTSWLVERLITMLMLPFQAAGAVLTYPFHVVSTLFSRKSRSTPERAQRSARHGKLPAQGGSSADRVPTRVSRR